MRFRGQRLAENGRSAVDCWHKRVKGFALVSNVEMKTYLIHEAETFNRVLDEIGRVPGIYRLHAQSNAEQFEHIPRLLGVDEQGILYIGTSQDLITRTVSLIKSVSAAYGENGYATSRSHPSGMKIEQSARFRQRFPFNSLCLTFERCEPDDVSVQTNGHTIMEWKKLNEYFASFGEFPPLNG